MFAKMKKPVIAIIMVFLVMILGGCSDAADSKNDEHNTIIDMAGRTVEVPLKIDRVYSAGQPGVVMLYTLCPDKLLGWCIEPSEAEAAFINAKYLNLPVLGLSQGTNSNANTEEIVARDPDIIILMTDINSEDTKASADDMQETFQIPVVVVSDELTTMDESYRFLGKLLGAEERAEELASYCAKVINNVTEVSKTISDKDKLKVYYAQGSTGLQTAPMGSAHSQVIELVGGINVCSLDAIESGRLTIDMEQLFKWNPDIIIASYSDGHGGTNIGNSDVFDIITNANPEWTLLEAVKKGEIFETPCLPYNWLDMPPSANRIVGVTWLAELLYPDYYDFDIVQTTKDFYKLFYRIELSDQQINQLLNNAIKK
ncbi:ABC transporter substrate-binding protein [Acetobacterium woodii]|uniref:ABC-type iron (III) transport system, periplasmic binding protein n=1 Tax=Acetobacterium woodii (strain ATCC 29683 / DSM 1030 / JCM 2381 / KCTC 1655 / WB1) TaxID=931626 RepID=H6LI93_ACEWD|nr:ABC transporter substrate-binding protein [Acetobacterium woodii]AFA47267.1 ABC-type iron (III) transport system, periplasmic binding protein [Acetobacterium woodii DSM 1030]